MFPEQPRPAREQYLGFANTGDINDAGFVGGIMG
jgi:hypothetical protein